MLQAIINKVILVGNLVRKPEIKNFASGSKVAKMTIAVNNTRTKSQDDTEFVDLAAWDKLAEICERFGDKGVQVYVEGRLHTSSYEDKNNIKRKSTEVVINTFQMQGETRAYGPYTSEGSSPFAPGPGYVAVLGVTVRLRIALMAVDLAVLVFPDTAAADAVSSPGESRITYNPLRGKFVVISITPDGGYGVNYVRVNRDGMAVIYLSMRRWTKTPRR
jgi:single-strand DNA-binding protein